MKKLLQGVILLSFLASGVDLDGKGRGGGQMVLFEKQGCERAQQGMAQSGKFLFSLEDGGKVNVYDFKKADGKCLATFCLASAGKDNHANNAEFGIERKKGADFPLLYVSVGKPGCDIDWTCFVESISRKGKSFKSELVQKIILDRCEGWEAKGYTAIFGSPSFLIDRERKSLWVFSAIRRTTPKVTKSFDENLYVATCFRIPALSEGSEVHLGADDILSQVTFHFDIGFTQAGCAKDGKIYYCFGLGDRSESCPAAIRIYDTDSGEITGRYDLKDIVLQEPEDVFIARGTLYLNTNVSRKSGRLPQVWRIGKTDAIRP